MKKFFSFFLPVFFFSINTYSQYVHKIKADSVLITNDSCTAELNLENSTKNVNGFLFNKGKGRTEFRKGLIRINDSLYIIGGDTLNIAKGIASGNYIKNQNTAAQTSANMWIDGNMRSATMRVGAIATSESGSTSTWNTNGYSLIYDYSSNGGLTHKFLNGYLLIDRGVGTKGNPLIVAATTAGTNMGNLVIGSQVANDQYPVIGTVNGYYVGTMTYNTLGTHSANNGIYGINLNFNNQASASNPNAAWFQTSDGTFPWILKKNGNILIGSTTGTDIAPALLNVESTTKGFLKPRLTTVQRDAIASPVQGLEVYNTTTNTTDYHDGTSWVSGSYIKNQNAAAQSANMWIDGTIRVDGKSYFGDASTIKLPVSNSVVGLSVQPVDVGNYSITNINYTGLQAYANFDGSTGTIKLLDLYNTNPAGGLPNSTGYLVYAKGGYNSYVNYMTYRAAGGLILGKYDNLTHLGGDERMSIQLPLYSSAGTLGYEDQSLFETNNGLWSARFDNGGAFTSPYGYILKKGGLYIKSTGTLTNVLQNAVNYGLYVEATGADNNYSIYANSGKGYFADNVLIGTTTNVPSAKLVVESITQGFLKPRMTTTQRDAIASPAAGLEIYNTTTKTTDYHNGTSWASLVGGTITSTQIGFGDGNNQLSSSSAFTFVNNRELNITGGGTLLGTSAIFSSLSSVGAVKNSGSAFFGTMLKAAATNNNLTKLNFIDNPSNWVLATYNRGVSIHTGYSAATGTDFSETTNERLIVDNSGNVGIGTTSPGGKLDIALGTNGLVYVGSSGIASGLQLTNGLLESYNSALIIRGTARNGTTNLPIAFGSGSAFGSTPDALYINTADGKIGIGTTSPTSFLDVKASTTASASLRLRSGAAPTNPNDGEIWNTGNNLDVRSGSVTYTLAKTLTTTATLDFPNTNAQTSSELTITIAGAADGDAVVLGVPNGSEQNTGVFSARVSAANTITVKFHNYGSTVLDPASGNFRVSILKY